MNRISSFYLVGAGLAELGVLGLWIVLPNAEIPSLPETFVIVVLPTDNRDGRGVDVPDEFPPSRRCGIRDGAASSIKSKNNENRIIRRQCINMAAS